MAKKVVWDALTGMVLQQLNSDEPYCYRPTLDSSKKLLVFSEELWDSKTADHFHTLRRAKDYLHYKEQDEYEKFHPTVDSLLSPNGHFLLSYPNLDIAFESSYNDESVQLWNLKPLLELKSFLDEHTTIQQATLLLAIYHTRKMQGVVRAMEVLKANAFNTIELPTPPAATIIFDLRKYPGLQENYEQLPDEIKRLFDPFVLKESQSTKKETHDKKRRKTNR